MTQPSVSRDPRRAFYVQVRTSPLLQGCWSVNINRSGIGLAATARAGEAIPNEGDDLELRFELPDGGPPLRVGSRIRWRADATAGSGRMVVSLGATFERFEGDDQVRLQTFLHGHRVQVAVAFATPEQQKEVREALGGEMVLHFGRSSAEVEEALARGDVAAVLLCGRDSALAEELLERLWLRGLDETESHADDLAPRLVFCAPLPDPRRIELFNQGRIFRALGGTADAALLEAAIRAAAQERGLRLEQRRATLALERALQRQQIAQAEQAHEQPIEAGLQSAGMRRAIELASVVAPHRVAVLLQGETGTGKEVLARRIHAQSPRASEPFVVQDCGALTETLLESELFGHLKGSFTGAIADHPGLFLLADGGTIFLDEIENTSANLQAKLLRVLETGDVRPVGGARTRRADVRVLAASNRDLAAEVRAGRFRADLYFRLNVFTIGIPPLRERREDIVPLAHHFIAASNAALGRSARGLSRVTEQALRAAEWPGNVRELRNVIERAVLLTKPGAQIALESLPLGFTPAPGGGLGEPASLKERLLAVEKRIIAEALEESGGVVRAAARLLRTDAVTLGRRVRRHGLSRPPGALPPRFGRTRLAP
jgi:two-component system response regulator HupR/HoxA